MDKQKHDDPSRSFADDEHMGNRGNFTTDKEHAAELGKVDLKETKDKLSKDTKDEKPHAKPKD